ncbi:uncharacterized protein ACA1_363300 [Acanthamoeba castellanii str. Neff]|uniref:Uncharacterized protein n=1 Tax=Acanthamoeba castellanii (strain ATCC 30010 / Neff) TaxID=1257118 RepID=L8GFG4_ACACF|nr:uncharacterized protein ACA1_363300 [Acanthamoeba castellanii str. Neff]ELR11830.1 hypothetical protein ACA1_363300 [Acanthamoeba castellanii str. Neff]
MNTSKVVPSPFLAAVADIAKVQPEVAVAELVNLIAEVLTLTTEQSVRQGNAAAAPSFSASHPSTILIDHDREHLLDQVLAQGKSVAGWQSAYVLVPSGKTDNRIRGHVHSIHQYVSTEDPVKTGILSVGSWMDKIVRDRSAPPPTARRLLFIEEYEYQLQATSGLAQIIANGARLNFDIIVLLGTSPAGTISHYDGAFNLRPRDNRFPTIRWCHDDRHEDPAMVALRDHGHTFVSHAHLPKWMMSFV